MATVTCTIAGSGIAGANNSRTLTISDADLQRTLDWLKVAGLQIAANKFNGGVTAGYTPTATHLEWAWFEMTVVNGTKMSEQQFSTQPPSVPPPISIT